MRRIASRHALLLIAVLLCTCATAMDLLIPSASGCAPGQCWREAAWAREP